MSLINKVLQDLDKRGNSTQIGDATVRVVHDRSRRSAMLLVVAGVTGVLALAVAAWFVWGAKLPPVKPPLPVAAIVAPVVIQAASQPASAVVQSMPLVKSLVPKIESVSPDPIMATGKAQRITIKGLNFESGATVILRNNLGRTFPNRTILEQTSSQIIIELSFSKVAGIRLLEVSNPDGSTTEPYVLNVRQAVVAHAPRHKQQTRVAEPQKQVALQVENLPEGVKKQPTQMSLQQQAENEFRRAYQLMRQGRNTEALAGYEAALKLDASHDLARQTMVSLLLENKRNAEAERILQEGLVVNPRQSSFAMLLARLQVERNALPQALETLLKTLPFAEKQADYQSFVAALMQRSNRHKEAITHYQQALQAQPKAGVWLMGLGISLRADHRDDEARDVFKRAMDSNNLNAELQSYVSRQIKELQAE